jgi:hypothetical protein
MSKQFLSLVCVSVLVSMSFVTRSFGGSTEESDRQFLASLESGQTAAPAPAAPAPETSAAAPVAKVPKSQPSQRHVVREQHSTQPAEVADAKPAPATTTVIVMQNNDGDVDHDSDREHHHHFFHRLFGHLFAQHPEDW